MNKFKVGDIVVAIADNSEFVNNEQGNLFKVQRVNGTSLDLYSVKERMWMYYAYKFRKATKEETEKFKFDYVVNKLKGVF